MFKKIGRLGLVIAIAAPLLLQGESPAIAAYAFTSHTFTPCGQTGQTGPTQVSCRSAYSTTWDESDTNFTVVSGIQIWTVPYTGLYRINAFGAAGSAGNGGTAVGGNGARVQGDFTLTEGDKIRILVGQKGTNTGYQSSDGASGSGGGGSFVISGTTGTTDAQVLLIAAGGGGSNDPVYQGSISNGLGGLSSTSGTGDGSNSGGSYRGAGASTNGASFSSGGSGGSYTRGASSGFGGFGGGGATDDARTGGGGWVGGTASVAAYSKNNGSNPVGVDATNTGDGSVTITSLGPTTTSFAPTTTLTNSTSVTFNLEYSQSVTGIDSTDFSASGTGASTCVIGSVSGSGTSYSIPLTSCSEGTVFLTLTANSGTNSNSQTGPTSNTNSTSVRIDLTGPTVSSVTVPNGNYSAALSANINLTVGFSESVTITGTPRIALTIGASTEYANFVALTDSRTGTFRFTVTVDYNDIDLDGIAVNSPLQLNSGTIADMATNTMTALTFTPPVTTSVNVFQPPSAPTIDSITANNTSLTIYFTAGASNGSTLTNYKVSTNNGSTFTALASADTITPVLITGLTNGITYQVMIKAMSNLGDGLASNMVASAPTTSVALTISLSASATTASKGTPITISVQVSQPGVVTFFWNDERIPGCLKKPATTTATCIWKPNVTGQWTIRALINPTDTSYTATYSQKLPVFILRRAGLR